VILYVHSETPINNYNNNQQLGKYSQAATKPLPKYQLYPLLTVILHVHRETPINDYNNNNQQKIAFEKRENETKALVPLKPLCPGF
jgi:transcriptional antiterminator